MTKNRTILVKDSRINIIEVDKEDYISLTGILKAKGGDFFIVDWLRNRNTLEFLGIWESVNNPNFNYGEFAIIKNLAGLNTFKVSAKEWIERTNAIGIKSSAGRYGGTWAHKDIAFEFGMWISPEFKVYLIKEFQRLKEAESAHHSLEWNVQRILAKINYRIHAGAITEILIPPAVTRHQAAIIYASEADVLNTALFGQTAASWRISHKNKTGNIRDHASLEQLVVLTNLESINAVFMRQGLPQSERLQKLNAIAISQMKSILSMGSTGLLSLPPV
jgi:hypothetical protein